MKWLPRAQSASQAADSPLDFPSSHESCRTESTISSATEYGLRTTEFKRGNQDYRIYMIFLKAPPLHRVSRTARGEVDRYRVPACGDLDVQINFSTDIVHISSNSEEQREHFITVNRSDFHRINRFGVRGAGGSFSHRLTSSWNDRNSLFSIGFDPSSITTARPMAGLVPQPHQIAQLAHLIVCMDTVGYDFIYRVKERHSWIVPPLEESLIIHNGDEQ